MSYQEQTTPDQTIAPIRDERLATHTVFETIAADPGLKEFLRRVCDAGLEGVLRGPDLITVLAPSNDAFSGADQPVDLASKYILRGSATAAELRISGSIKSLNGNVVKISGTPGDVRAGHARFVRPDIECTNGVLHVIDSLAD